MGNPPFLYQFPSGTVINLNNIDMICEIQISGPFCKYHIYVGKCVTEIDEKDYNNFIEFVKIYLYKA